MHKCPCCGLPTLSERGVYDICTVCWWEDDGQDDAQADEVYGGPNHSYSLTHARQNYRAHGHMYDPGQGISVVENPSPERQQLVAYALSVTNGTERLNPSRLAELIGKERAAREADTSTS